jgi:hypothetical protein
MPVSRSSSFPSRWRYRFVRTAHGTTVDGISPTAVAVGMVLSEYADWNTGGGIRPGRQRVAAVVGVSVPTVTRSIAALTSTGWIATDERGSFGKASTYRLTIPALEDKSSGVISLPVSGSPVSHSDARETAPQRLTGAHSTGSPVSHQLCMNYAGGRRLTAVAA